MNGSKAWYLSRTLWLNLIGTVIAVLMAVLNQDWIADHPQLSAGIGSILGVLNILLRFLTSQPIVATNGGRHFLIIAIAALLVPGAAFAQDQTFVVKAPTGDYLLVVKSDGNHELHQAVVVTPSGTIPPPPPGDDLTAIVRTETARVTTYPNVQAHKSGLSILYQAMAQGVGNGSLTVAQSQTQLEALRQQLWGSVNAPAWANWVKAVDPVVNQHTTAAARAQAYMEVANGLDASPFSTVPGGAAARGDILNRIIDLIVSGQAMQIIEFLLKLLDLFGGGS